MVNTIVSLIQYRRLLWLMVFACIGMIIMVVSFNISQYDPDMKFQRRSQGDHIRSNLVHEIVASIPALEGEVCRVQFVFAGPKYDYTNFDTLSSWIHFADPTCTFEFIRSNHSFLQEIKPEEKEMLDAMEYLPILQADFMKLLVIYYLGGIVTDLDVEAVKPYPSAWIGSNSLLSTCNVVLGVEVSCYDDGCSMWYVRKGQIQNWAMFASKRKSPFLGALLDQVVKNYKKFPNHDKTIPIQEVAGSGIITDFLNQYINADQPYYELPTSKNGETIPNNPSTILRIHSKNEEICIVGPAWTGTECLRHSECLVAHHFEGSWKDPVVNSNE